MRIYLSSTLTDLQAHREALRAAIQSLGDVEYVGAEYFSASSDPPLESCLSEVRQSSLMVLILGWRYGYIAEGQTKSIVELEYETALEAGVGVLCYVIDENYPVPPKFIETGQSAEADP